MKNHVNGFQQFFSVCLLAIALMFVGTSCTKSNDIECPGCDYQRNDRDAGNVVIDEILIFQQNDTQTDSTNVVIDDILIF